MFILSTSGITAWNLTPACFISNLTSAPLITGIEKNPSKSVLVLTLCPKVKLLDIDNGSLVG